ncbi:MAG TPA: MauE/DoxX family redox-associated membrane protein [Actinomycetota bacterium]|nr:MauE/DoxX family redox-associated membrane protein [Actinomycetota bacterium]
MAEPMLGATAAAAARFATGTVIAFAGAAKFLDVRGFAAALRNYPVIGRFMTTGPRRRAATILLASAEATAGLSFAAGWQLRTSAPTVLLLLALFSGGILLALARGESFSCHCFGQADSKPISWWTLGRNVTLLCVAAASTLSTHVSLDAVGGGELGIATYLSALLVATQVSLLVFLTLQFGKVRALSSYVRHVPRYDESSLRLVWAGTPEPTKVRRARR